jgi:signal transduction histidine kinase
MAKAPAKRAAKKAAKRRPSIDGQVLRGVFSRAARPSEAVDETVLRELKDAGILLVEPEAVPASGIPIKDLAMKHLATADFLIADITGESPWPLFMIGAAQALAKPVVIIANEAQPRLLVPSILNGFQILSYSTTPAGLQTFASGIRQMLTKLHGRSSSLWTNSASGFLVDWDRISREDGENLCRELLAQLGFRGIDWAMESREIDMVAELARKDPDGFEYREVWLVSMGRNAPIEMLIDMASDAPEMFLRRFYHYSAIAERLDAERNDVPVTVLLISWDDGPKQGRLLEFEERSRRRKRYSRGEGGVRLRVWDRTYLTTLVQQHPQLGYKYFSEEGRSKSKYRKTPEELYQENAQITTRLSQTVEELKEERGRRVRAERDAAWKDISFAAAHKIGNPVFAIETILGPLEKRITDGRTAEAIDMSHRIQMSVEKAKEIVNQFKSLALAQKIEVASILLDPILRESCQMATDQGVECTIEASADVRVLADPTRLAECIDELVRNSLNWFDKEQKNIWIAVQAPALPPLPAGLDSSQSFVIIHYKDNGPGVPLDKKSAIFDAFYTTSPHGTGLGLALVRRIVDGHGGIIIESGRPGDGVDFEIYLPLVESETTSTMEAL